MASITTKLEKAVKALDEKQLKKALYLTEDNPKTARQHEFVEQAARVCLANKSDKKACESAIKEARDKVQETISLPVDDTSLEGLEEYLSPKKPLEVVKPEVEPGVKVEKSDEELFEDCQECHVAVAATTFAEVCTKYPEINACNLISEKLGDQMTEPVDWIKAMIETAEKSEGKPKEEMVAALTELTDYLERKNSPWLKELERGNE
jgi:hypothetical protein